MYNKKQDPIKVLTINKNNQSFTLSVFEDKNNTNPRDFDNLGHMLYMTRNIILGDERTNLPSFDEYIESAKLNSEEIISLPMYYSDLDNVLSSEQTSEYEICVGVNFVTYDKIKKHFNVNEITEEVFDKVESILENEIDTYNAFINKKLYFFKLEKEENNEKILIREGFNYLSDNVLNNGMLDNVGDDLKEDFVNLLPKKMKFK